MFGPCLLREETSSFLIALPFLPHAVSSVLFSLFPFAFSFLMHRHHPLFHYFTLVYLSNLSFKKDGKMLSKTLCSCFSIFLSPATPCDSQVSQSKSRNQTFFTAQQLLRLSYVVDLAIMSSQLAGLIWHGKHWIKKMHWPFHHTARIEISLRSDCYCKAIYVSSWEQSKEWHKCTLTSHAA